MQLRIIVILLLISTAALAAPTDKIAPAEPEGGAYGDALGILDRKLPAGDHQTVHYVQDGYPMGWATRRGNNISFYDDNGIYLGYAARRSQTVTKYFAADGTFLGIRYHQILLKHGETKTEIRAADVQRKDALEDELNK